MTIPDTAYQAAQEELQAQAPSTPPVPPSARSRLIEKLQELRERTCTAPDRVTLFAAIRALSSARPTSSADVLLDEMLREFGKDGHGGEFEDGEHPLIDRVREHLEGRRIHELKSQQ